MALIDYKCNYEKVYINRALVNGSGLSFPRAHCQSKDLVTLSKLIKEKHEDDFCILPFCHTLEAEAMGGMINLGDSNNGPRVKDYVCTSAEDILELPEIDCSKGRLQAVLKAAKELENQGETVVFHLSGPFTILNALIKPRTIFKTFKKDPELMQAVFDKLQRTLLNLIREATAVGVRIISFADSSGGLNILGPNFFMDTLEMFTIDTLKKMSEHLGEEGLIILCPKTSLGIISSNNGCWEDIPLGDHLNYRKNITKFVGKADFIGETCLKNKEYKIKDKKLKTIVLND